MQTRRDFMQGALATLASVSKPLVIWLYSTAEEGIKHCPVSAPMFDIVSFDLPCHGADIRSGEPTELFGWRYRLEQHLDLFEALRKQCNRPAIIGGVSRGAFAALYISALDDRFQNVVALSPVTDLTRLAEFIGFTGDAPRLDTVNLAKRNLFFSIEKNDTRVSTIATLELVRYVKKNGGNPTLYLEDGNEHTVTPKMQMRAKQWIESASQKQ